MYTVQAYEIGGMFGGYCAKDFDTYEEAEKFFYEVLKNGFCCDVEIWHNGKIIKD